MPGNAGIFEVGEPDICKRFMLTALRDSLTMLNDNLYEFLPVFLLISWLSLRFDKGASADFENCCIGSDIEPKEKSDGISDSQAGKRRPKGRVKQY